MANLPHLPLPQSVERKNYLGRQTPRKKPTRSQENLNNRPLHVLNLTNSITNIENTWQAEFVNSGIRPLLDERIIPILLKIDSLSLPIDTLRGFGIEVISEEFDGYVIGASVDALNMLKLKIDSFAKSENINTAYLWEIENGIAWKRERILTPELIAKIDQLADTALLELEISIACNLHLSDKPIQKDGESIERYQRKLEKWTQKAIANDELFDARYEQFSNIASIYGTIKDIINYEDSFAVRAELSVKGIKDILYNYPYVFEIAEHDYLSGILTPSTDNIGVQATITPPSPTAPKVCVIDSGIMEGHRLLSPAIDIHNSRCYIPGEKSVADHVQGGGHGTRVAGAILYPNGLPNNGNINLKFWIQNARVLNDRNNLQQDIFPPRLMMNIVSDYLPTKIYNLSICSNAPCQTKHMSLWASTIDKLTWVHDILFVIAVGNIAKEGIAGTPGIRNFINNGLSYPDYLTSQSTCRISNPSQSSFSLSVGSVTIGEYEDNDRISFGKSINATPAPSPFSRTGLGLWGMVKPDVVEFAGDLVREKNNNPIIVEHSDTSPHLVKSIQTSSQATGKDKVGTSFAAPKVSTLVANLQENFPRETCMFYRGLVVQSARLPHYAFNNPSTNHLRHFGYGLPNVERALDNTDQRVTLYANGKLNAKHADLYTIKIPNSLNRPGNDFDVLIEVTLSYKANPRRTRMRTSSYLSTWLDWKTSKLGEPYSDFRDRIINIVETEREDIEEENDLPEEDVQYSEIPWKIRERGNFGDFKDVKRQDSTLQKDWTVMPSNTLPDEICIAILGHRGWSKDLEEEVPYSIFISFEILSENIPINIYEIIRVSNQIDLQIEAQEQIRTDL